MMDVLLRLLPFLIVPLIILLGMQVMLMRYYKVAPAGKAIVKTGVGGTKVVTGRGLFAIPMMHRLHHVHTEAEAFDGNIDGVPRDIVVQANLTVDDLKRAFTAFGNKDRDGTRDVLQALIDSSATAAELESRLAEVGYRRI